MIVLGFIGVFVAGLLIGGATASVMNQARLRAGTAYNMAITRALEQGRHEGREEMRSELTPPEKFAGTGYWDSRWDK